MVTKFSEAFQKKYNFTEPQMEIFGRVEKFVRDGGTHEQLNAVLNAVYQIASGGGKGQASGVRQDLRTDAVPASTPMPDGGHFPDAHQGQSSIAPVRQPIASGGGPSGPAQHDQRTLAPPAREPNKPRGLVEVKRARIAVASIFETYLLCGRPLIGMTRQGIIAAHVSSARKLKSGLRDAAASARDFIVSDQMLKHCQADDSTPAEKMFKPADLERFDRNALNVIEKSADAVADVAFAYVMQKTMEISNAG